MDIEPVKNYMVTSVKAPSFQPASIVHNSSADTIVPKREKHNLIVPSHQQSVMSNISSLWKARKLCDAFISNGTVDIKVNCLCISNKILYL